ncbi:hypothetical protein FRM68_22360 [Salmonella enterica subsp. enterica]|nr:hypothetical protein [Salmonella enterica subsp. enterica serovar Saintpaul]EBG0558037.1 hypothetical protein [Salmonella enterica subsp. enterica serovar Saintpaul]ECK4374118.1 hypothetical protein [Salmonella enterica subsp. enterica serovar Saintpaul]
MFAGKKSAQIREILISESTWEEMTCLFAPSLRKARHANQGEGPINQLLFLQEHILLHEEGFSASRKKRES